MTRLTRALTFPERAPGRTIATIGLLFALAYGASLFLFPKPDGRLLIGDALHHYVQLRSAVFDGDLQFRNDYVRMYGLRGDELGTEWVYDPTPTGYTRNLMPVGPALLWGPAFLLVSAGVWTANLAGAGYPLDGYSRLFQSTAGFTGIAAAALGVWLSFLASRLLFPVRAAIWSCLILWLSSSAVYYSLISPTYSHAPSLLTMAAFWYAFVRTRGSSGMRKYLLLGVLAGLAALMRWQDAIVLVVPAIDLAWRWRSGELAIRQLLLRGMVCVAAAACAFVPQMIVWQALYGRPLAIPQGGGFMRWTEPALFQVLFSDNHGLLTWTPIVAVALGGFFLLVRRDRLAGIAVLVLFGLSWYVNAAAGDWWAGEAFGARRFVSCFPLLALGLTAVIDRWSPSLKGLATAGLFAVAHTFLLLVQYQAFLKGLRDTVPYPTGVYGLWVARFVVPFDLLAWWWNRP
jgi:hypothetical protein